MNTAEASHTDSTERSLLRFSVWMGIFFAVLGIVWGMAIQSGAILFDGIYSGFSIILSMLSILSLRLIGMTDDPMAKLDGDEKFPFGRVGIEPLVVALKSIVIIGVCLYAIVTSVSLVLNGGAAATSSLLGILYAGISIILCLFSWLYLKVRGKGLPMLVQAESEQWLIDTVFSGVVLAGFCISYALAHTGHSALIPFIDPGIVLLGSLYFIRVPLLRFVSCMRELLMMAPADDIKQKLQEHVDTVAHAHGFTHAVVRSAKVGRELTVDIALLAHSDFGKVDIEQLDSVRAEIRDSLSGLGYRIWMNVIFTKNRYWA